MRSLVTAVAFLMVSSAAYAVPLRIPSPEMDLGVAGLVMVAGAAFLAYRRRG
jgi:LPXTG-motif cell wall-anchored protein